jgi:predicted component of type VI protein secretion system
MMMMFSERVSKDQPRQHDQKRFFESLSERLSIINKDDEKVLNTTKNSFSPFIKYTRIITLLSETKMRSRCPHIPQRVSSEW